MDSPRRHLLGETLDTLTAELKAWDQPGFRARQIFEWVYRHEAVTFEAMSSLPQSLRARLAASFDLFQSEIAQEQHATDRTVKCLLRWPDGTTSECVMIPDGERRTACLSSQVGCPVGCVFCASGLGGLERQLTAGQIVEQAMRVRALCGEQRLSNIVMMGLGEPLANYDATLLAVRIMNAPWGLGIGARRITISTVGLPGRIRRLADEGLQLNLALSLHAPDDDLRQALIPWAERVTIDELIDATGYYFERTGREITLEYILLDGVNDSAAQAADLARVARRLRSNVNLIAYNPVEGLPYGRPAESAVGRFLAVLREKGVNTHVRRSRGLDIDAACGQLRRRQQPVSLSIRPD